MYNISRTFVYLIRCKDKFEKECKNGFPSNTHQPIFIGNQPIYDVVGDESPASTDIVGNTQFPAAFAAYDGTTIYFRIRLNSDPRSSKNTGFSNFAWGVLINTSGDPGVYDWLANVNGLDNTINLVKTQRVYSIHGMTLPKEQMDAVLPFTSDC
ncbi:hypothetical protein F6Y02_00930 [Bacillus megaterium]|nr:hypothetical protein [Priestia megaterium]